MTYHNRRKFLADVGKGMLIASVGLALAANLGISSAFADIDLLHPLPILGRDRASTSRERVVIG